MTDPVRRIAILASRGVAQTWHVYRAPQEITLHPMHGAA
jgi:hypothetical protein